ncbi:hypothetical protein CLAIMM_04481 [Cladophialophora immunda]|nr:hypothetical protein CLAIMM_04481 [Cladophialophora immunda]
MTIRRDITLSSQQQASEPTTLSDLDVLIVGAGFAGIYLLYKLRAQGYKVKILEAGPALGGTWYWNCYPGARVDSPVPIYEYSLKECWEDWSWKEKYPGWQELRDYFDHVDKKLDISKDVIFDTRVVGADFDNQLNQWSVSTQTGTTATCKYLLVCCGFSAKRYIPDWKGLDDFKGVIHHSSFWPDTGVDVKGKRLAVIGTGSTGIQIIQELAPEAEETFVFQRTPNLCLPMGQENLTIEQQNERKSRYAEIFKHRMTTFAGFEFDWMQKNTSDVSAEEREKVYEQLWQKGGFEFWVANFKDLLFDNAANRHAYDFWVNKTRARITDPVKRDLLAPLEPPHPFGTKRPSLEQNFYEICNQENVHIVNTSAAPIVEITETGIRTSDGKHYEVDVIAVATGFDAVSGGLKSMGLRDTNGTDLADRWADGTSTYLGLTVRDYPNMFMTYTVHGPTAFCNGPSCVETQADIILDMINKLESEGKRYINATVDAEQKWGDEIQQASDASLFPLAKSWYMGANIPGKKREQLNYLKGLPTYDQECRTALANFSGFVVA